MCTRPARHVDTVQGASRTVLYLCQGSLCVRNETPSRKRSDRWEMSGDGWEERAWTQLCV